MKEKRLCYLSKMDGVHTGVCHEIQRSSVFKSLISLYREVPLTMMEYPFRVRFKDELAVDLGGVSRDLFSAFWESAYTFAFDGSSTLIPQAHPHTDMSMYPVLGTILSHGFLVTGILPVRLSFPTVAATIFGPTVDIPANIYISLVDYLSPHEGEIIREAFSLKSSTLPQNLQSNLISILSRLGCRQVPSRENITRLVVEVAKHEFIAKPLVALYSLKSGVPVPHSMFWEQYTVNDLYSMYKELIAVPSMVIQNIETPDDQMT